jgi:hypothetical protein
LQKLSLSERFCKIGAAGAPEQLGITGCRAIED